MTINIDVALDLMKLAEKTLQGSNQTAAAQLFHARLNRDISKGDYVWSEHFDPPMPGACHTASHDLKAGDMVVVTSAGLASKSSNTAVVPRS